MQPEITYKNSDCCSLLYGLPSQTSGGIYSVFETLSPQPTAPSQLKPKANAVHGKRLSWHNIVLVAGFGPKHTQFCNATLQIAELPCGPEARSPDLSVFPRVLMSHTDENTAIPQRKSLQVANLERKESSSKFWSIEA